MSVISFLLDENVRALFRRELLRREPGLEVRQVGGFDAPPKGTPDSDILHWCEAHSFVLVTDNRKSMPQHLADHLAAGHHVPGILLLNSKMGIGELLTELLTIWGASEEEEYYDRLTHLPIR